MFNTGLRTGEVLGLLNSDVDLDKRVLHLQRGVKEVSRRNGAESISGREVRVGKLKSASSKRDVPLNQAAVDAILDLRAERYFGEDTPLIPDENGGYTRPVNFRRRYYRILEAAGIEQKGLHSIRHTFATTLVNGIKIEKTAPDRRFDAQISIVTIPPDRAPPEIMRKTPEIAKFQAFSWQGQKGSNSRHAVLEWLLEPEVPPIVCPFCAGLRGWAKPRRRD